jgi:hypothetical protein
MSIDQLEVEALANRAEGEIASSMQTGEAQEAVQDLKRALEGSSVAQAALTVRTRLLVVEMNSIWSKRGLCGGSPS